MYSYLELNLPNLLFTCVCGDGIVDVQLLGAKPPCPVDQLFVYVRGSGGGIVDVQLLGAKPPCPVDQLLFVYVRGSGGGIVDVQLLGAKPPCPVDQLLFVYVRGSDGGEGVWWYSRCTVVCWLARESA